MDKKRKWIVGGALALAVVGGGTGLAIAAGGDDDRPLTGSELDKATAAALEHTGGGIVIETDVGEDGAAYGVEIRLENGRVVELFLDADFHVTGEASDDDASGEQEGNGDQNGTE